jgi:4-hydroxy-tetrahydrodipicolinate synthase
MAAMPLVPGTMAAPVKAALAMMGKIASDEVRLPLVRMSQTNRDKLRRDLQNYGIPLQN